MCMLGCSPDTAATQCLLGTPSDTEQTWAPTPLGSSCLRGGVLGLLKLVDLSWSPLSSSKPTSYLLDGPKSPRSQPSTLLPRNWAQRFYPQCAQGPEARLARLHKVVAFRAGGRAMNQQRPGPLPSWGASSDSHLTPSPTLI